MPKRVEDVLQSRHRRIEALIQLTHFRDDLNEVRQLTQILENACTAIDIPTQFHANAVLAEMIWWKLGSIESGLQEVQELLR